MSDKIGKWILYPSSMEVECTKNIYDIFGIPEGLSVGSSYLKTLIEHDDWHNVYNSLINTIKNGNKYNIIYRINRPIDNTQVWVHAKAIRNTDDPNNIKIVGTLNELNDISPTLKQIEYITRIEKTKSDVYLCMNQYKDLQSFISKICEHIGKTKGYLGVWIGIKRKDDIFGYYGYDNEMINDFKDLYHQKDFLSCCTQEYKIVHNPKQECLKCPLYKKYKHCLRLVTPILSPTHELLGHMGIIINENYITINKEITLLKEVSNSLGSFIFAQMEKEDTQKALTESMKLNDVLFNSVKIGICTLTLDGTILTINDEFASVLGHQKENVIGLNIEDFTYHEDLKASQEIKSKIYQGILQTAEIEKRYLHKNGSIIWGSVVLHLMEHENKKFYIASIKNITPLKKQNEKLIETQKIAKVTSIEYHVTKGITKCSSNFYEMINLKTPLIGEELKDYLYTKIIPEDRYIVHKAIERAKLCGKNQKLNHRYIQKDGNIGYVSNNIKVEFNKNNKAEWLHITIRDVTDVIQQKKQLDTQAHFIEQSLVGIAIINEDFRFTYANHKYLTMWGYESKEEILDISIINHFVNQNTPYLISDILSKKTEHTFEFTAKKKNGSTFEVLMAISKVIDDDDEKPYYISSLLDITEQKISEKKLRQKDKLMLMQSRQAAMGEMISMIAHQWRQPLNVITMINNNILIDLEFDNISKETICSDLMRANEQAIHMSKTIEDFRDFFKPEKEKETTCLTELVNTVKRMLKDSLTNNDITFYLNTYGKNILLNLHKRELLQVILNLVNNAKDSCKASKEIFKQIWLQVEEDEQNAIIKVIDNGIGISSSIKERIYEPYFTTKKDKHGTGLGLYMSKNIVEKHLKGKLEFFSENEKTIFKITLPKEIS